MIAIDGARGEGGGQIVRSALTLSLLTGQPFRIKNVREGRKSQGLLRQHLTAINACTAICNAKTHGVAINSREFSFEPKSVKGDEYHFAIGSAGSTTLIFQTILLPLLSAPTSSKIILEGGTHNPWAPPFDFIERSFLPILRNIGASVSLTLERPGFYPAGGGKLSIEINPSKPTNLLNIATKGELRKRECRAIVAGLPSDIAKRELATIKDRLGWADTELKIEQLPHEFGPGNVVLAELSYGEIVHVISSFGERGVRAEDVAITVADQVHEFINHKASVGRYLADQLLLPCVWAGGGSFTTPSPSNHFKTNLELIKEFITLDCEILENSESLETSVKIFRN